MKKIIITTAVVSLSILVTSCSQKEKLPPPVNTVEEAKTLITGKTWKVVDVATISGIQISFFDKDHSKNELVVAPATESLNWLSNKKEAENSSEFINSFYNKSLEISIALNKDSIATTTGLDTKEQTFLINNDSEENEPKGLKLLLIGESQAFAGMGTSKFTATYYILGANEKKLYLLTPNKLNDLKVVYLLESE